VFLFVVKSQNLVFFPCKTGFISFDAKRENRVACQEANAVLLASKPLLFYRFCFTSPLQRSKHGLFAREQSLVRVQPVKKKIKNKVRR